VIPIKLITKFIIIISALLLTSCSLQEKMFDYQKSNNYSIQNDTKAEQVHEQSNLEKIMHPFSDSTNTPAAQPVSLEKKKVKVISVIDGTTIVYLENGVKKTGSLIGVKSPESSNSQQSYEKKATDYLKKLVLDKEIEIESDPKGFMDKYGRYLIYALIGGKSIQYILLKEGLLIVASHYKDYKYGDLYKSAETIAKQSKLNIWSNPSNFETTKTSILNETGKIKSKILDGMEKVKEKFHF
jgi:endonuclease YncB( thermonuclease family)